MALIILMSDFNGKGAESLVNAAYEKSDELDLNPILFPENGLHPEFHMELADKYLKEKEDKLIVTHSENLLLRFLRRIARGEVEKSILQLSILTPYINNPERGFYWKHIGISEEGEFIDNIPGGFFEQGYRERFDIGEISNLHNG